ncbi:MAG TPA: cyclic nucleotide-binding domain-containing protein [Anaerolineales bacterium]|nr:cyclic nucleotide-binding domain-containing protein [Anaerolineales bacterium]
MPADYFDQLREEVEREVMACIGCNDCLLACPLPEKRFVTIAELNAGVLSETIKAPNVAAFVSACTQCGQCIPACPADLHRADMVLWNKMKVENAAPDQVMPLQVGETVELSQWTLDSLAQHLTRIPLFEGVDPLHLRRMLLSSTLRQLVPDEILCREGQYHERLFVVLDGQIEQSAMDSKNRRARILVMGAGSFHGELAVLGNQEEAYTLTAIRSSIVLELTKGTVYRLKKESSAFRTTMDELYRRRALWTFARQSPLLSALPERAVESLLKRSHLRVLRAGEVLYREGDRPGNLYIARTGFLKVARKVDGSELVLQYFREGDVFGVTAALFEQEQSATVSANTRSEVIVVPGAAVQELLNGNPDLRRDLVKEARRNEELLQKQSEQGLAKPALKSTMGLTTTMTIGMEGLLDQGIIQGHELLVINTAICTNCNNCVDSCERRHGHSRLERRGLQMGNLLFPTACRHCEDPVCLLCSVNGIVRRPDGEIEIVNDNCIGCGACAERCPYGNIQMHDREPKSKSIFQRFSLLDFFKKGTLDEEQGPERIAVKCNLCAGFDDYACVRGCPVGAAMRVNPVEQFRRTDLHVGLEAKKNQ